MLILTVLPTSHRELTSVGSLTARAVLTSSDILQIRHTSPVPASAYPSAAIRSRTRLIYNMKMSKAAADAVLSSEYPFIPSGTRRTVALTNSSLQEAVSSQLSQSTINVEPEPRNEQD